MTNDFLWWVPTRDMGTESAENEIYRHRRFYPEDADDRSQRPDISVDLFSKQTKSIRHLFKNHVNVAVFRGYL